MGATLKESARRLLLDIFGVKSGETVVITADYESNEKILRAVSDEARELGATVMVITIPTPRGVGKSADPDLPIEPLTGALSNCDVWIEFNHQWLLYSTPFERATTINKKLRYMCLVDFDEELMIRTIGNVETKSLQIFMRKVVEITEKAKIMKVTTPTGCDVTFEIDPNHYIACDCGDASNPGVHMLTGQLNIVPRFGSINGKIVFEGSLTPPFGNTLKEPVTLIVESGVITNVTGGEEAKIYDEYLKSFKDPGMLKMAHIAYGFNPGAKLTGNIVEDERVWGCTEWGIGYVSNIDAPPHGQDAVSHSDGICLKSSVWLDGVQIMDEGKIVHPELVKLVPKSVQ